MGWTDEYRALVKRTKCAGLTDDEFAQFEHVCTEAELDPLRNQILAQIRNYKDKKGKRHRNLVVITQIDGFRLVARRDGLAGIDDAVFKEDEAGRPISATVTVYRWGPRGIGEPPAAKEAYTATARMSEYNAGGSMWGKMPHTMLAKCAEALALRKGFQTLSGLYTADEMAQADAKEPEPPKEPDPMAEARARFGKLLRERRAVLQVNGWPDLKWQELAARAAGLDEWPDEPDLATLHRAIGSLESKTDAELMGTAPESGAA